MQETQFNSWVGKICLGIDYPLQYSWTSLMAQLAKNLPAMRETWVGYLGWIPGLGRSPGERKGSLLQYSGLENSCIVHGVANSPTDWATFTFTFFSCHNYCHFPGEGNGNPLQYSCLGNLMNREGWQTMVHGITKSRTQLSTPKKKREAIIVCFHSCKMFRIGKSIETQHR